MSVSGRHFLPGPVDLDPVVVAAMTRPMIGHRTTAGRELLGRVQPGLRRLFGTTRPVMLATASATALMEAAIRSGVRERVLCVVGGTFGERFARIAEACGKEAIRLHVPRGMVLEPELLAASLDGPPVDAVTLVHAETSTGALAPVAALLALLRPLHDVVTIVDAVASVGASPVATDAWGADFVLTASQKALALPPGLAFAVASDRFLQRAEQLDDRGLYLDVVNLHRAAVETRFPQTPAMTAVFALEAQLERIDAEGLEARWARHAAMRERVERWADAHGVAIMAPAGRRADAITALRLPEGRSARAVVEALDALGWAVAGGMDEDADRVLRIGHMGDLVPEQLDPLLDLLTPRLR